VCNPGYYVLNGKCIDFCPGWTKLIGEECRDETAITNPNSKYLMKYFCDNSFRNEEIIATGLTISPIIPN